MTDRCPAQAELHALRQRANLPLRVIMRNNTILNRAAFQINPPSGDSRIGFTASRNLLLGLDSLFHPSTVSRDGIPSAIRWDASDYVYERGITYIHFGNRDTDAPVEIESDVESRVFGSTPSEILTELQEWHSEQQDEIDDAGAEWVRLGPGKNYHLWRKTAEYKSWNTNARAECEEWVRGHAETNQPKR